MQLQTKLQKQKCCAPAPSGSPVAPPGTGLFHVGLPLIFLNLAASLGHLFDSRSQSHFAKSSCQQSLPGPSPKEKQKKIRSKWPSPSGHLGSCQILLATDSGKQTNKNKRSSPSDHLAATKSFWCWLSKKNNPKTQECSLKVRSPPAKVPQKIFFHLCYQM